MFTELVKPDASDDAWRAARVSHSDIESLVRWRTDNPNHIGAIWEDLAWSFVQHFPDDDEPPPLFYDLVEMDPPARLDYADEIWANARRRERPGSYDRLLITEMGNARRAGWAPPPEFESLFSTLDAQHAAEDSAKAVAAGSFWNEWARVEFKAAQTTARANPQWWTDLPAAIKTVIDTDRTPPSDVIAEFGQLVTGLVANDAWRNDMDDLDEAVRARAMTLIQQVERGCANMAHMKDYARNRAGEPEANNPDNVHFLLQSIGCEVRYNAWLERAEIKGESRFIADAPHMRWDVWSYVDDNVVSALRTFAARTKSRFCPAKDFMWDTLLSLARKNAVDPAIDLLDERESAWDGTPRLDTWLSFTCGVPADAYHAAVGRNVIGGMVKRIRHPGAKHDEIALLVGPEGTGKSTLVAALSPRPEWFTESIRLGDEPKELVLSLAGKAVAEISEMSASTKDVAAIKAMVSRTTDAGRTAYARSVTERPRRNIFVASTNDDAALVADTGNRRFLPVRIEQAIDMEWLRANSAQLIGEAAALESEGETFELPREVWVIAAERQEANRQVSEYELHLAEWFAPSPLAVYVTAADLSELVKAAAGRSVNAKSYSKAMRRLGFGKATRRTDGKPSAVWHRGDLAVATRIVPHQVGSRTIARVGHGLPASSGLPPIPSRVDVPPPV